MFTRLRNLGKHPSPEQVLAALREAYLTTFAFLAAPGVLLGLLLGRDLRIPLGALWALLGVSAVLVGLVVFLTTRARREETEAVPRAVRVSIQLASAPAVPFLMGCALLGQPAAVASLWGLAALVLLAGLAYLRP